MFQAPYDEDNSTNRYCYISNIENTGSKVTNPNVQEIDYIATVRHSVEEVAEATANNE
ncbi:hypothetical protein SCL_2164 [Sulfuricaulis limicola]|uniref:Uncharacterized protein n=1 Tax=Sulfuricaulis limicola TaxID=1620215 RepID=A0A1B4XI15_9GAMM|nr:hypothetical protein SCL_2164 [Sulfuricaulis limicola]